MNPTIIQNLIQRVATEQAANCCAEITDALARSPDGTQSATNPDSGFEFSIGEVVEVTVLHCKAEAAGFTRWTETTRATVNTITQHMVYLTASTGEPRVAFRYEIHKAGQ